MVLFSPQTFLSHLNVPKPFHPPLTPSILAGDMKERFCGELDCPPSPPSSPSLPMDYASKWNAVAKFSYIFITKCSVITQQIVPQFRPFYSWKLKWCGVLDVVSSRTSPVQYPPTPPIITISNLIWSSFAICDRYYCHVRLCQYKCIGLFQTHIIIEIT